MTATHQLVEALVLGARVIACVPRSNHISPVVMQLHWLPVSQRIEYKVLILAFTAIKGKAPRYICDMVEERLPQRATRS